MNLRRSVAVLMFFFLPAAIFSQYNPDHLAILPFQPLNVSKSDADILTNLFETAIVDTNAYTVIEQNRIGEILEAQERSLNDCTDEKCAIEVGKLLTAEKLILGSCSNLDGMFILTVKIIDVRLGKNIRAEKAEGSTLRDLAGRIDDLARRITESSTPDEIPIGNPAGTVVTPRAADRKPAGEDEIRTLRTRAAELRAEIQSKRNARTALTIAGWSSLGVGAAGILTTGVLFLAGSNAMKNYRNSTLAEDARRFREEITFSTQFMTYALEAALGGAAAGTLCFLFAPDAGAETAELEELEAKLGEPGGIR